MDIMQAIIKVYMQCFCNTPCLFTWCLMTNRRRWSGSAAASDHDIPRPVLDLKLPKAEMHILARPVGCYVPADGSPIKNEAVLDRRRSTFDTDEVCHSAAESRAN